MMLLAGSLADLPTSVYPFYHLTSSTSFVVTFRTAASFVRVETREGT